jgi:adenylate cyclase
VLGWGVDLLDRPHFRKIIGRYVGAEPVASLPSERREVSIVVAGLPELAALSEKMAPDEVATQLGEYGAALGEAIVHHDGVIDRVSGDLVMAVFGGPARPDHPVLAVRAAAAMHDAVAALNDRWAAAGLPRLRFSVGIHTGRVVAAGVGDAKSAVRCTVVGVDVEVARHVYALTTELDTTATLVTEATRVALGDRMTVRDHGAFSMKQLGEEVRVYELVGREV